MIQDPQLLRIRVGTRYRTYTGDPVRIVAFDYDANPYRPYVGSNGEFYTHTGCGEWFSSGSPLSLAGPYTLRHAIAWWMRRLWRTPSQHSVSAVDC